MYNYCLMWSVILFDRPSKLRKQLCLIQRTKMRWTWQTVEVKTRWLLEKNRLVWSVWFFRSCTQILGWLSGVFFFSKQGTNRPDLFVVLSMHFTSSLTLLSSSTVNFVVRECLHVEADLTWIQNRKCGKSFSLPYVHINCMLTMKVVKAKKSYL